MTSVEPITSQPGATEVNTSIEDRPQTVEDSVITQQPNGNCKSSRDTSGFCGSHNGDCVCCYCWVSDCQCEREQCCCCLCNQGGCYYNTIERSCEQTCSSVENTCCECVHCQWTCCDGCCANCGNTFPAGANCNDMLCHCNCPCCSCLNEICSHGCCHDCSNSECGSFCCGESCDTGCCNGDCGCCGGCGDCEGLAGCCECLGAVGEGLSGLQF